MPIPAPQRISPANADWWTAVQGVLDRATVPQGILASPEATDNYRRIWARDAVITGLCGLWSGLVDLGQPLEDSLCTLAEARSEWGQIPSNVGLDGTRSFGTLAGRVDATFWWMLGLAERVRLAGDDALFRHWLPVFEDALRLSRAWEMNGRGLVYTPPGGNWADEYPLTGYTLYDNTLRWWAVDTAARIMDRRDWAALASGWRDRLLADFSPTSPSDTGTIEPYHPSLRRPRRDRAGIWWSAFGPEGYQSRWDLPAHALALLAGLPVDPWAVSDQIADLGSSQPHSLPPVFHPVIRPDDPEWARLRAHHLFAFKNEPHAFHNGASWPVFNGLLAWGLAGAGASREALGLALAQRAALARCSPPWTLHEYFRTDREEGGGQSSLCFTAAGSLLLIRLLENGDR